MGEELRSILRKYDGKRVLREEGKTATTGGVESGRLERATITAHELYGRKKTLERGPLGCSEGK